MPQMVLPIFPLPNVVFFPSILLPLHVFEPRYRLMVEETLKEERDLGICLLQEGWQADYFGSPPVHRIGCAGKIETYERLPEGRFNILLRGIERFEIINFVQEIPYRLAAVNLLPDAPLPWESHVQKKTRDVLFEKFYSYFTQVLGMDLDNERLDRSAPLETVVNQLASVLDIPVLQKQGLLEAATLERRLAQVSEIVNSSLAHAEKLRQVVRHMRYLPENPEVN